MTFQVENWFAQTNRLRYRAERTIGRFYRSFSLPSTVDVDAIEAKVEDGVLNVRVPKAEEVKPRKIEVA